MVEEVGAAVAGLGLGAEAGVGAAGAGLAQVGQHFGTPHALEFSSRKAFLFSHAAAQGGCQRAAVYLPELADLHLRGVHLQGRAHGGVEFR